MALVAVADPDKNHETLFDLLASAIGLLLLAVPLALLAWQVRRKLGSPVLFTQVRPGLHGKPFRMVKFRTMTDGKLGSDPDCFVPCPWTQDKLA